MSENLGSHLLKWFSPPQYFFFMKAEDWFYKLQAYVTDMRLRSVKNRPSSQYFRGQLALHFLKKTCLAHAALETIWRLDRFLKTCFNCMPFKKVKRIKKKWYFSKSNLFWAGYCFIANSTRKAVKWFHRKRNCSLLIYTCTNFQSSRAPFFEKVSPF